MILGRIHGGKGNRRIIIDHFTFRAVHRGDHRNFEGEKAPFRNIVFLSIIVCLFFSYQYAKLAELPYQVHDTENVINGAIFHYFFDSFVVPVIYYNIIVIAYFYFRVLHFGNR